MTEVAETGLQLEEWHDDRRTWLLARPTIGAHA